MKRVLPLFLMVASVFGEQVGTEKVEMRTAYEPGKTYLYSQTMNGGMSMQGMEIQQEMGMDFSYVAEEHEKGTKLTMSLDKMTMKMGSAAMPMVDFDSSVEAPAGDPTAQAIGPMLENSYTLIMDKDGKTVEFDAGEAIPGAEALGMNGDSFKQMMESGHQMMPSGPVAVGDSWDAKQELPMGALGEPVSLTMSCKLVALEELDGHKVAKVDYTCEIDGDIAGATESPLSMKFNKMEGTVWHDLTENVTRKSAMSMDMVMGAPAGVEVQENGMGEIPYTMDTEMILTEIK